MFANLDHKGTRMRILCTHVHMPDATSTLSGFQIWRAQPCQFCYLLIMPGPFFPWSLGVPISAFMVNYVHQRNSICTDVLSRQCPGSYCRTSNDPILALVFFHHTPWSFLIFWVALNGPALHVKHSRAQRRPVVAAPVNNQSMVVRLTHL